jgi:hypothetical protein
MGEKRETYRLGWVLVRIRIWVWHGIYGMECNGMGWDGKWSVCFDIFGRI